jgi:hypothetical protein
MVHFNAPRTLYRWQRGLLLRSLPRRFIAGRFRDLPPGGSDDPLPEPIGQAHACQGRRLSNQGVVLWQESNANRRGVCAVFFLPRSSHDGNRIPVGPTSQGENLP